MRRIKAADGILAASLDRTQLPKPFDPEARLSSGTFRRDGCSCCRNDGAIDREHKDSGIGNDKRLHSTKDLNIQASQRDARHRFRLLPAAMWEERAGCMNLKEEAKKVKRATTSPVFTSGESRSSAANRRQKGPRQTTKIRADIIPARDKMLESPLGKTCVETASLSRPPSTATIPLRWQSRVMTMSSLVDRRWLRTCTPSPRWTSGQRRSATGTCRRHGKKRLVHARVFYKMGVYG